MNKKSVNEVFEKAKNEILEIKNNSELENKILKKRLNMLSIIMNNLLDEPTRSKIYYFLKHTETINDEPKNYLSLSDVSHYNVCISDKEIGEKR